MQCAKPASADSQGVEGLVQSLLKSMGVYPLFSVGFASGPALALGEDVNKWNTLNLSPDICVFRYITINIYTDSKSEIWDSQLAKTGGVWRREARIDVLHPVEGLANVGV